MYVQLYSVQIGLHKRIRGKQVHLDHSLKYTCAIGDLTGFKTFFFLGLPHAAATAGFATPRQAKRRQGWVGNLRSVCQVP
jgi:hypothetical protein